MYILTDKEMRFADEHTIQKLGVPSLTLMERAGVALADEAARIAPTGKILCVCGGGNNGGDGFVCARILRERGRAVEAVFFAERISEDCRINKEKWESLGGKISAAIPTGEYALLIDCLVGTGLQGSLRGRNAEVVAEMNGLKRGGAKVLSADVPSGICGGNGRAEGVAVHADVTLCIGEIKIGCVFADGLDYAGEVKRADIGITLPEGVYAKRLTEKAAKESLPIRKRNSHKGSYGKAAIVAGSLDYTGAAYLSAAACLRSGAGYTTLFVPKDILSYYVLKAPEILLKETNEGGRYEFNAERMRTLLGYDSIAYGMGMGVSGEVARGAAYLLENYTGKLILDADGLNSLAAAFTETERQGLFADKKCDVVLTPHVKEFSRLSGKTVETVLKEGPYAAKEFAESYGVAVLLKNASSVITDGNRTAVNTTGCSGLAKGGSGDVLAGVIAGLCAQGVSAFDGGCLGAYLVGKAAELAAEGFGEYSLTASDVIGTLGKAFLLVAEHADEYGGEEKN